MSTTKQPNAANAPPPSPWRDLYRRGAHLYPYDPLKPGDVGRLHAVLVDVSLLFPECPLEDLRAYVAARRRGVEVAGGAGGVGGERRGGEGGAELDGGVEWAGLGGGFELSELEDTSRARGGGGGAAVNTTGAPYAGTDGEATGGQGRAGQGESSGDVEKAPGHHVEKAPGDDVGYSPDNLSNCKRELICTPCAQQPCGHGLYSTPVSVGPASAPVRLGLSTEPERPGQAKDEAVPDRASDWRDWVLAALTADDAIEYAVVLMGARAARKECLVLGGWAPSLAGAWEILVDEIAVRSRERLVGGEGWDDGDAGDDNGAEEDGDGDGAQEARRETRGWGKKGGDGNDSGREQGNKDGGGDESGDDGGEKRRGRGRAPGTSVKSTATKPSKKAGKIGRATPLRRHETSPALAKEKRGAPRATEATHSWPLGRFDTTDDNSSVKWCVCRQSGDAVEGNMILCDNADYCLYGWYHTACIGVTPRPGKWYCDFCTGDREEPESDDDEESAKRGGGKTVRGIRLLGKRRGSGEPGLAQKKPRLQDAMETPQPPSDTSRLQRSPSQESDDTRKRRMSGKPTGKGGPKPDLSGLYYPHLG